MTPRIVFLYLFGLHLRMSLAITCFTAGLVWLGQFADAARFKGGDASFAELWKLTLLIQFSLSQLPPQPQPPQQQSLLIIFLLWLLPIRVFIFLHLQLLKLPPQLSWLQIPDLSLVLRQLTRQH